MQIKYDLERSLRDNPPEYGEGITWIDRVHQYLPDLITTDKDGNSLNGRDKDPDTRYHEGFTFLNEIFEFFVTMGFVHQFLKDYGLFSRS